MPDDHLEIAEGLPRTLNVVDGTAIIFGIMIGTGIFASPGVVLSSVHESVGLSLLIWLCAGILCLLGGLCFAELGAAISTSGGDFAYLVRGLHPLFGFMYAWASFICTKTGSLSIIAIIFGRYFGSVVFSLDTNDPEIDKDYRVKMLAIGSIIILSVFNLLPVKWSSRLQNVFVIFKFLAIGLVVIFAIIGLTIEDTTAIAKDNFTNLFSSNIEWTIIDLFSSVGIATISALWAYDGFSNLNMVAEEVKNPGVNIPISIVVAVSSVTTTYVLINICYLCVMTASEVVSSKAVAVDMAEIVAGKAGEIIMPLLVASSAFGALNGSVLVNSRVFFAAAREGLFPFSGLIGRVNQFDIPYVAVLLQALIACILIIPGNFESLVNYFGFVTWIFNALVVISLIRMRYTEKDLERPFKVKPFPWIPIIFVLVSFMIVISAIIEDPVPSLVALLIVLLSVPVYYMFFWKGNILIILYYKCTGKTPKKLDVIPESDFESELEDTFSERSSLLGDN